MLIMRFNQGISLLFLIVMLLFYSCEKEKKLNDPKNNLHSVDFEILQLKTDKQKESFLTRVFESDQEVRKPEEKNEILKRNNYDLNSKDFKEYVIKGAKVDSLNFYKIRKYLYAFGYPSFQMENFKASSAIHTILLHQSFDRQMQLIHYPLEAYRQGKISGESFSFLLNKMHLNRFGKSLPSNNDEKAYIEELIKNLNLDDTNM